MPAEPSSSWPWRRRAKRVIAREVDAAEATRRGEVVDQPATVAPVPRPPVHLEAATYVPRRRKHTHLALYRTVQLCAAVSLAGSALSLLCLALGDVRIGQAVGAAAIVAGMVSIVAAAPRLQLTQRVKGYAVAATVFAALCLSANVLAGHFWNEEHPAAPAPGAWGR